MKKIFGYISLIMALFIAALAVSSCIINDAEPEPLPIPSLDVANDGMSFTIACSGITNMKYANIIRESCDDPDFGSRKTVKNIGQVVPTENFKDYFQFNDSYISGNYYRYYVRFYDGSNFYYTNKTTVKQGPAPEYGGKEAGLAIITLDDDNKVATTVYEPADEVIKITMNAQKKIYTITVLQNVKLQDSYFGRLGVVFENKSTGSIRPFTITDVVSHTDDTVPVYYIEKGTIFDLQKELSPEFLDVELYYIGLTGIFVKPEDNEPSQYTNYYWTQPFFTEDDNILIEKINSEGNPDSNLRIEIPSTDNQDNIFDVKTKNVALIVQ